VSSAQFDSSQGDGQKFAGLTSKYVRLSFTLGLLSLALLLILGEILIRLFTVSDPEGPLVGNLRLLPRYWPNVANQWQRRWRQHHSDSGVLAFDPILGWTVAPNKKGVGPAGEKLFSSTEGARARDQRESFRDRYAALSIALIGNSYVFGSDVNFEDTWGYHLEQRFGGDVKVLNFGVPGYGVDQAYLRYLKDVRELRPKIAILGLISHDLLRTTMVYYAVGFPGAVAPGAKPRFMLIDGQLKLINTPLPSPEDVYAIQSIEQLPYIVYDRAYRPSEWQSQWYDVFYLFRFVVSFSFAELRPSTETVSLNRAILNSFVREATSKGTLPLIVYLPSYLELSGGRDAPSRTTSLGVQVLKDAEVDFVDLTDCVEGVEGQRRFTRGWHYTPHTNSVLADCLHDVLIARLSRRAS